jgi:ribose transport system permease protein
MSMAVSLVYIFGRNPIVIATMGMALLYESVTCIIYDGGGVSLVSNIKIKALSTFPAALIPLVAALAIYAYYNKFSVYGKQSELLANNQQAAVNIGVNEKKNVFISYIFSGLIFGLATAMFASTALHRGAFSSLSTVGQLFSNIVPVFFGLMIERYSGATLGVLLGSVTLSIMAYGLSAIFSAELGGAISTICVGAFIFITNVASAQGRSFGAMLKRVGRKGKEGDLA